MNRDDLKKYRCDEDWVKKQKQKYIEWQTLIEKTTKEIDGMPHAKNKPNYFKEELLDNMDKLVKENNEIELKLVIENRCIQRLSDPYRKILNLMYVTGNKKNIEELAESIGYAYNYTSKLHRKALNLFDEECKKYKI